MASLRAIVVDDEPLARARLRRLLEQQGGVDVVAEGESGESSIAAIRELKPDVAFLDVRMPDMDGFDVLDALGAARPAQVVFVTAYSEHAVRAFEARAIDYLLKPVSAERLRQALARLPAPSPSPASAGARGTEAAYPQRIAVPVNGRIHLVDTAEIDHVDSHANYVELHLGARSLVLRETMTRLESRLDPQRFLRVHRSRLVRVDGIVEARAHASGRYLLRLKSGAKLVTGRSYQAKVRSALGVDA
jgi:two-component system LytT family response regulator